MITACAVPALAGDPCTPHWNESIGNPGPYGEVLAWTIDTTNNAIAGGEFLTIGPGSFNNIASWDGASWSPLGNGFEERVNALEMFNNNCFAAGVFVTADGNSAPHIAQWTGAAWNDVGGGADNAIHALTTSSVSGAEHLYAGGLFLNAGGTPAKRIARWDGASWSALGSGVTIPGEASVVYAIKEFDLGAGPMLAVGGLFTVAGGQFASNIAVWDGAVWSPVGAGVDGAVRALAVFDDGTGPALYAAGAFDTAGGGPAKRVAKWDGAAWSAVGGTGSWGIGSTVRSLTVFDEGDGPVLLAGGDFLIADGISAQRLASWDGAQWTEAFGGADSKVSALAGSTAATETQLLIGGAFSQIGAQASNATGEWIGCATAGIVGDLNNDGTVDTADLGSLIASFGTSDPTADINGDGIVDTADLGLLIANFGA